MQKIILILSTIAMLTLLTTSCSKKTTDIGMKEETTTKVEARENRAEPRSDQNGQGKGKGKGERPKFAELLAKLDANNDGKLSSSEVKGPLKENFTKVDSNNDGFISETEFSNAPPPPPRGGGRN